MWSCSCRLRPDLFDSETVLEQQAKAFARVSGGAVVITIMKHCFVVLLSLLLGGCFLDLPGPSLLPGATPPPPGPPQQNAVLGTAQSFATAAKMIAPFEISDVRPADHGGPGAYYVCLREANPPPEKRRRYYAIFFDGDAPKGFRLSVIMDECEKQTFNPLPAGPATPLPADNTQQPTEHKKHRGASAA